MRPVSVPRIGLFVKVCVPAQVFEVVVPKAREMVFAEFTSGYVNASAACLPLNVEKSEAERRPRTEALAVGRLKVNVPPVFVMPQSLLTAVVEVARVMAPVCAEPEDC